MSENPLLALKALGQHIWLDNLSRPLLREGDLQRLINEDGVDGVTSNPAIFEKAIGNGSDYRDDLARLRGAGLGPEACYEALVIDDIQAACAMLLPAYHASRGETGYVSLEVSPNLANDAAGTIAAARRLRQAVGRKNLLIKVPATPSGIEAVFQLTAEGLSVNVTLIFSLAQYEAVTNAYLRGAIRWLERGGNVRQLRSVASIFLSRVDTLVDERLMALDTPDARQLGGRAGVALAKCCHGRYLDIFHGTDFVLLRMARIRPQTLLWASTGSKNKAYSDVMYIEPLIGPESICTLPEATLAAFRRHGQVADRLKDDLAEARVHLQALSALGIDLNEVGETLQIEGVRLFAGAYENILSALRAADISRAEL